jgi:hypothetical protein
MSGNFAGHRQGKDTLSGPFDFAPITIENTFWRRFAQGDRLEKYRQTSGHSRGRLCHTSLPVKQSRDGPTQPARKVNGFWVGVCQDGLFPRHYCPKILLTVVFFSPIMRGERPRAASAGKTLEAPGKASIPAVCGPSLGPQLPRPHVV